LTVTTLSQTEWQVTGGLEPHRVRNSGSGLTCDCQDFTKGNTCKHILAIKRTLGDAQVSHAIERIGQATSGDFLDLTQLWFSR
jgi:helicase